MSATKWAVAGCEGSESSLHSDGTTKTRICPFDPAVLPFDYRTHTAVEISPSDPLFSLVVDLLGKHGVVIQEDAISFRMARAQKGASGGKQGGCCGRAGTCADPPQAGPEPMVDNVSMSLGMGLFRFSHRGRELKALHQHVGDPVGTGCGAQVMTSLVLFREGMGAAAAQVIREFLSEILAESEKTAKNTFQVYRWHVKNQFWMRVSMVTARPVASVVLPVETSKMLVDDLSEFLSEETAEFYFGRGIPYKRSYLFYGIPGSGKTSMIQALAGRFGRNLCYLSPTHPELSDDSLKSAIEKLPQNAIVVLEDVDALFGRGREKKIHQSPLTFSGLLNALDGVGNHNGMVFVLTTNFKEQLDAALIRDGRVDVRVRFDHCIPEQMERMFDIFYPQPKADDTQRLGDDACSGKGDGVEVDPEILALEAKLVALKRAKAAAAGVAEAIGVEAAPNGAAFRDALLLRLGDRSVTAAQLQSFFVAHRKSTAAEAIADVGAIVAGIDQRAAEEAEKEEKPGPNDGERANAGGAAPSQSGVKAQAKGREATAGEATAVHVHIHGADK